MTSKTHTKRLPKTVVEDAAFHAPKAKKQKHTTLAEALEESGETIEELAAPTPDEAPVRPAGTSNLATTIRSHRHRYVVALHPNGKKTQNNGDVVAVALLRVSFEDLRAFWVGHGGKAYEHLNDGHARMCIGNKIRADFRKGEDRVLVEWVLALLPADEETAAA